MKPSVMLVTMVMCLVQVVSSQNNGTMTQLDRMEEQIQIIQSTLYNMESEPCVRKEEVSATKLDCSDIQSINPDAPNGVYTIKPEGLSSLRVYCDMTTDGGGWLVFQRRKDGSENFYRNWADYQRGFGSLLEEFWLGNDALHLLTYQKPYELRIELEFFNNERAYAVYSDIYVEDRENLYKLSLGTYSGTAGDSLSFHNNQYFSTYDADHDTDAYNRNCAKTYKGGWWYSGCHKANLNGIYLNRNSGQPYGIIWEDFKGRYISMKFTEMKIRHKRKGDSK